MRTDLFRTLRSRAVPIGTVGIVVLSTIISCRATTENVTTYGGQLPRPQRVVVYDFTSTPGDVQLQSGVGGRIKEELGEAEGTSLAEQQSKLQQNIVRLLTTQLVQEIGKLGLGVPVQSAEMVGPVTEGQLSIEGQFLTIDEGNQTKRLVIGFGKGASHVRIAVQVLETVGGQHRLVEDFYTNANSSRKPGFGPMAGIGAAAGAARAATAGAGIGTTAIMGSQDAEGDTKEAAEAISKELGRFFAKQGWISSQ
jgi:uncharacterized protein DUF4410